MKSIQYIEDFEQWRSGFTFAIPIKVRFSETDLYGHVNNTSVFVYFEEARIEYLQSLGLFTDIGQEKDGIVVADLQCNYLEQMYFNETINFYVKTNEVGNASFDIHYMAVNEKNKVTLTGRGRIVYIDLIKKRAKAIPKNVREILEHEIEKLQ
ncbi:acyl-CoA thioesterase [Ralstonia pickettii]|nr:acyl-CoA thioesterase [Ralstonia pickettii]